jgi:hypothetical protein
MQITPFDFLGYPEDDYNDFESLSEDLVENGQEFNLTPLNLLDLFLEVEKNINHPNNLF